MEKIRLYNPFLRPLRLWIESLSLLQLQLQRLEAKCKIYWTILAFKISARLSICTNMSVGRIQIITRTNRP